MRLQDAILIDVDGTVAEKNDRHPFAWEYVGEDTPRQAVLRHIKAITEYEKIPALFASGREDVRTCRIQTDMWITHWFGPDFQLFMRPEYDRRPDTEVKQEIYLKKIKPFYNIIAVWDDRDSVVAMWRSHGLDCFQVQPGNF